MTGTQYAILGYAVSLVLLIGFSLWQWSQFRMLSARRDRRRESS